MWPCPGGCGTMTTDGNWCGCSTGARGNRPPMARPTGVLVSDYLTRMGRFPVGV